MYRTLRTTELKLTAVDNETAASVLSSANTVFVPVGQATSGTGQVFMKEVSSTDTKWARTGAYYIYNILLTEHNIKNITDIIVNKKLNTSEYENIIFSYKKYLAGSVGIILSEPMDIEIIIKGV